jgi:SAM-dependent methyltransferase/pyruvate-formate lyase-activating enzyme
MAKPACVVPWTTLDVGPDGTPIICCQAPVQLTVDGRPASLGRDPLPVVWNAPELLAIRDQMARGEAPVACAACWQQERRGPTSLRTLMNGAIHGMMGADWSLRRLMQRTAADGHRLASPPRWFQLQLGNTCNLACRSCSPTASSRIGGDRVHRAWSATDYYHGVLPVAPPRKEAWYRDPARVAELVGAGDEHIFLSLLGGEPFLIAEVWELLRLLAERGWARRISLGLVSNGTRQQPELERLAPAFERVFVSVSIDGYGPLHEYLRYGAKWSELVRNLDWLQSISNIVVVATPTLQNLNALGAVKLFRFLDRREVDLHFNVVTWPRRLAPTNLPPLVRRIAAQRLRHYLDEECRATNRLVVQSWAGMLEGESDFDPELFGELMLFTNDLDAARGQRLASVEPELVALLRAAGVRWTTERRHGPPSPPSASPPPRPRVRRVIDPRDAIYPGFARGRAEDYFDLAHAQVDAVDALLREHGHPGVAECRAVADFAPHYGRLTRVLVARLPHAVVYACDIDEEALAFCARELAAVPVTTGWRPDEEALPAEVDLVVCVSLLTHTPREHLRRTLRAWRRMLAPGGVVVFTYLSPAFVERWLAGEMEHYGSYAPAARRAAAQELAAEGFAFLPLPVGPTYGGESFYGITFASPELVRAEIEAAGLEPLLVEAESPTFGQALAVARLPGERRRDAEQGVAMRIDARVVALYDPRGYQRGAEESAWSRLMKAPPPRSLPTELGFADPRVPEVREAQAALAGAHGVDAFCWLWLPGWEAPLRDMLASGRPDFPFCLQWMPPAGAPLASEAAERVIREWIPYLHDPRYLRQDGRPLLVIGDGAALAEPRTAIARWRALAAQDGIGELHLCVAEPLPAETPQALGFDSALEATPAAASYAEAAAAALVRARADRPLLRCVPVQRRAAEGYGVGHYELWLRSVIDASEGPVFVRSWNDWAAGAYLEPDDRDGRGFLAATRRAARGPSSGLALLRRLRDALPAVEGNASRILAELEQVVSLHERARDELRALVEAAYAVPQRNDAAERRWVPVTARHLEASSGRVSIDQLGGTAVAAAAAGNPVPLEGDEVVVYGWAHSGDCDPAAVDVFLVLTAVDAPEERVYRMDERHSRPDVAESLPGYPASCGFAVTVAAAELPAGTYRLGVVQRTPTATYYDPTAIVVRRD